MPRIIPMIACLVAAALSSRAVAQPLVTVVAFQRSATGDAGALPNTTGGPFAIGLNDTDGCQFEAHDFDEARAFGTSTSQNCVHGASSRAFSDYRQDINDCMAFDHNVLFEDSVSVNADGISWAADTSASSHASTLSNWRLTFDVHAPAILQYIMRGTAAASGSSSGSGGAASGAQLAEVSANLTSGAGIVAEAGATDSAAGDEPHDFMVTGTVCLPPGRYVLSIDAHVEANCSVAGGNCIGDYPSTTHMASTYMNAYLGLTPATTTEIYIQPSDTTGCPGTSTSFGTYAFGDNLTYQWRKNGAALTDGPTAGGSTISGAATDVLYIDNVSTSDAGSYDCLLQSTCSTTPTDSAVLTVPAGAPTINAQPAPASACRAGSADFTVSATGAGLYYRWRHNQSDLADGPSGTGSTVSGASTPHLTITGVGPADVGAYDCHLYSDCGDVFTNSVALSVIAGGTADGNSDGSANGRDVQGLINALLHGGAGGSFCAYDMNADGSVTLADVQPFVARLLN